MKNIFACLLLPLAFATFLRGADAGLSSISFSTSQAEFTGGDSITIREVLATSPRLAPGDRIVVRGQYVLRSRDAAALGLSLSTSGPSGPTLVDPSSRMQITAGGGTFE